MSSARRANSHARRSTACHAGRADGTDDRGGNSYQLADAFCKQARVRISQLFSGLWDNTDALDVRLAKQVLDGRYTWLEEGIIDPSIEGPWIASTESGPSSRENVHRSFT